MMDRSDEATKTRCRDWSTGKFSAMSLGYNAHLHFAQISSKLAGSIMLPKDLLTSLRAHMLPSMQKTMISKMLLSYALQ